MLAFRLVSLASIVIATHGDVTGTAPPAPGAERGRPIVLVVHGRGQLGRDTAEIRRDALRALQGGARTLTGDSLLRSDDVRLVWYADLLDSRAQRAASTACVDADSLEREHAESSEPNALRLLASLAGAIIDAAAEESPGDGGLDARRIGSDLRYLADPETRCAARLRVSHALRDAAREGRPIILVAHSFGAFVAWDHLRLRVARAGAMLPPVTRFVTMGSPLGSMELRQLVFGEEPALLSLPVAVSGWTNVIGTGDPFAMRITEPDSSGTTMSRSLADMYAGPELDEPHQLASYLHDAATARVVLGAWCDAFSKAPRSIQGSCGKLGASATPR